MGRKRKYLAGPQIKDPLIAFDQVLRGNYVMWHGKPRHPSWMISLQVNTLAGAVRAGNIRFALLNEEVKENGE